MLNKIFLHTSLQVEAVEAPEGPVMITGGPGSGKTSVLVARILNLLLQGARGDEMVVLTTTPEMVEVLAERISALPYLLERRTHLFSDEEHRQMARSIGGAQTVQVKTFEQCSCEILRDFSDDRTFTVWDDAEVVQVLAELARNPAGEETLKPRDLGRFIKWYSANKSRDPLNPRPSAPARAWLVLEQRYEREKRYQRALDRHDLVPLAAAALEKNSRHRAGWVSTRSRHIFVDCGQDLTWQEYLLLKGLTGPTRSVTVAADPNQRLSVRPSADPLEVFLLDHRDAQRHGMVQMFRRTRSMGNTLLSLMDHPAMTGITRQEIRPVAFENGAPPVVIQVDGPPMFMYSHVIDAVSEMNLEGVSRENLALIFPDHYSVGDLIVHLLFHRWPFVITGNLRTASNRRKGWDTTKQTDTVRILQLVRCLLNPRDWNAFSTAAGALPQLPGPLAGNDKEQLLAISRNQGTHLIDAARVHVGAVDRDSHAYQALRFVIDMWDAADRIRDRGPQRLCREVARVWTERTGVHLEEDSAWQETVALAESVLTAHGNDPGRQLAAFLDRLSPAFQPGGVAMSTTTPQGPALTLTTLERARGREWDAVFVIGSPGQLVPVDPGTAYDRREAEARQRRLCIAATRAKRRLVFVIYSRHGEGGDAAERLAGILGEGTEVRYASPQRPANGL